MIKKKVFVIVGPTASGKSGLAIKIAQKIKGTIINADAIQTYQDLSIISARPNMTEMQGIPHLLYGYLDAWTQGTVQDWLKHVIPELKSTDNPILVGGTGLYLLSLINGINEIPEIDPEIRKQVRSMPIEKIKEKLKDFPFTDTQRLQRALEVLLSTGKSITYFQNKPLKKLVDYDFQTIFLNPPREKLYKDCAIRFFQMIEQGGIEEVKKLQELKPTGGVLKAIGVSEILQFLNNQTTKNEMIEKSILSTRHYAKRQITWFKHQLKSDIELQSADDFLL